MVEFEDVRGAMVFSAKRFTKRFPGLYEIDELVNEIYISPFYQKLPHQKAIWKACLWAMCEYHRYQVSLASRGLTVGLPAPKKRAIDELWATQTIHLATDGKYRAVEIHDSVMSRERSERGWYIVGERVRGKFDSEIASDMGLSQQRVYQIRTA